MCEHLIKERKYIANVINRIFREMSVKALKYKDRIYYPYNTIWYGPDNDIIRGEYDPDHPCICHMDDYDNPHGEECSNLINNKIYVQDLSEIKHIFRKNKWSNKKIKLRRHLMIVNENDVNHDHRGSNHMKLNINHAFTGKVFIPEGVYTYKKLADLIWRVKANKFDNNYELFCIIDRYKYSEIFKFIPCTDMWVINLPVDHGS